MLGRQLHAIAEYHDCYGYRPAHRELCRQESSSIISVCSEYGSLKAWHCRYAAVASVSGLEQVCPLPRHDPIRYGAMTSSTTGATEVIA